MDDQDDYATLLEMAWRQQKHASDPTPMMK
jgi:hypothetical protein